MRPSEQLTSLELANGWRVVEFAARKPTATGGTFSTGYLVENEDGRKGFLKAMDYTEALAAFNTAEVLRAMTEAYLFEKQICEKCRDIHLRRVVHAIDAGSILPDPKNLAGKVEYLIFERADGDIRGHLDAQAEMDVAFLLRVVHNVAVGISQLHGVGMAHQDLKPSNVLVFAGDEGSKVADLGRAWAQDLPSPHDGLAIAGDRGYAPPELLYRGTALDNRTRRFGCDVYHLGSLLCFLFSRAHLNAILVENLEPAHRPFIWGGSFDEVLPYLHEAFGRVLEMLSTAIPALVRDDVVQMIKELCEPDPSKRGHPLERIGHHNQFSLQRYISRLDFLAKRVEYHLLGKK